MFIYIRICIYACVHLTVYMIPIFVILYYTILLICIVNQYIYTNCQMEMCTRASAFIYWVDIPYLVSIYFLTMSYVMDLVLQLWRASLGPSRHRSNTNLMLSPSTSKRDYKHLFAFQSVDVIYLNITYVLMKIWVFPKIVVPPNHPI